VSVAAPTVVSLAGLPQQVLVHEVGPRDGLQNEAVSVPTSVKAELVCRLFDAGLSSVEVTSFVRPDWVPQLADAEALVARLPIDVLHRSTVLVPNRRGLQRALDCGISRVAVFASATESFSIRNLNRTVDESMAMFSPVVGQATAAGATVRAYVSMCFGDPWEGAVDRSAVVAVGCRLLDMGCGELSLGDTIGVATPGQVAALLDTFDMAGVAPDRIAVHFHDTYGQALANTLVALQHGVTTVDASAGGLGGCPYAKSATGNLPTEDLLWQLAGLGIATGIDLGRLVETSRWLAGHLGRPSPSRVVAAYDTAPAASDTATGASDTATGASDTERGS